VSDLNERGPAATVPEVGATATSVRGEATRQAVARTISGSPPEWMSPAVVAAYTGIAVRTWRAWLRKGIGPAWSRLGKHLRVRRAEVDAFIESKRVVRTTADGHEVAGADRKRSSVGRGEVRS
jgi:excisionase family DNA binding protein